MLFCIPLLLFTVVIFRMTLAVKSPVLIYGATTPSRAVFPVIKEKDFADIVKDLAKTHTFVIFFEDDLKGRDLSCKDETQQSCYGDFPSANTDFTFYASVENPYKALQSVVNETKTVPMTKQGDLRTDIFCEDEKYSRYLNVIHPDRVVKDRAARLEFRGQAMRSLAEKLSDCRYPPVFFYMASLHSGYVDENLSVTHGAGLYIDKIEHALENEDQLYVKEVVTTLDNGTTIIDIITENVAEFDDMSKQPEVLQLKIEKQGGYYNLYEVTYKEKAFYGENITWPENYSYAKNKLVFKNGNEQLRLNQFQLEILEKIETPFSFKTAREPDRFLTPGIASGLFVSFILLSILTCGISMLADVKACDRFDDPETMTLFIKPEK